MRSRNFGYKAGTGSLTTRRSWSAPCRDELRGAPVKPEGLDAGFDGIQGVYAFIIFCRNHRKDRFDEPAARFRWDEKANLPVDHQFPKLALGRLFVGSTPINKIPKTRERVRSKRGGAS